MNSGRGISLLYVNDDSRLRELVRTQLENESDRLDVVTADSAEQGGEILAAEAIDCILCDYHMPEETGVEFLERVREDDPDIPFLLFTETGSEQVASESIEAGVTDYIIQDAIGNQAPLLVQKITTHVDHRRARRDVERRDEQLREIASVTDEALWVFSPDWSELRFINQNHEALFGQSTATIRDDPASFLEKIHPDDLDRVELAMQRASAGEPQVVEYRVNKSETVQLWVESRCQPVTDEDGNLVSLVGLSRDITDKKANQRDLVEKVDQLEEFASTVAHDLRNPLNVVDGNVRLAAAESESEHLDTALDAVERMDTLIEELLVLGKQGELVGDRRQVEFAELVTGSYEHVRAPGSSLDVTGSISLECDLIRTTEAFENIVRNAVEHGSSDVSLTAGVLDGRRGVYIEDDGPGIPPDEREQVFEKGHTSSKAGSGFGLAIVKRIVDGHGWDVSIRESAAGGARFEIEVPEEADAA